jgi:hypothetical protein
LTNRIGWVKEEEKEKKKNKENKASNSSKHEIP